MTEQRTDAWFAARCGLVTASRAKDVMTKGRGSEPSKTRQSYIDELVSERLTGRSESFSNAATDWGQEQEYHAVSAFEELTGEMVQIVGFIQHPTYMAGASPDGLIGDDYTVEVKCPYNSTRHLRCFVEGMPDEHMPQVQFQLWITGRKACRFISYDPRILNERLRLFTTTVLRNDEYIARLEIEVVKVCQEVDAKVGEILAAAGAVE